MSEDDNVPRPPRRRPRRSSDMPPERVPDDAPLVRAGGPWPMAERSVLATVPGVRPIASVGLAAVLTAVGVVVDLTRIGSLGTAFTICHIAGCVLAVAWVRRDGLFGPMVQPPLLVAAAVPTVVLLAGDPRPGQGVAERLLVIGAPLVNAFPIMAWATGSVLAVGIVRMLLQRPVEAAEPPPARKAKPEPPAKPVSERRSARDAARGAGRTSGSPRRS